MWHSTYAATLHNSTRLGLTTLLKQKFQYVAQHVARQMLPGENTALMTRPYWGTGYEELDGPAVSAGGVRSR
jgi:hypothetical protein